MLLHGMPASMPQAHALFQNLPPVQPESATEPLVLIPSALKLTREQEDALIEFIRQRKDTLASELGLRDFTTPNWHVQAFDDQGQFRRRFLDVRFMAMMAYQQKYEWRPEVLGGIFQDSNLHVPLTRRILQQVIARLITYFLGSDPYFAVYDVNQDNKDLSDRLDRYLRHVLDQENDTKSVLASIIERILVCGECPVFLNYGKNVTYYQASKSILVDESGKPIFAIGNKDYIIEKEDVWIPAQVPVIDQTTQQPALDPLTQAPIMQEDPSGAMVLKRDGVTPRPANETYQTEIIWRRSVTEEGPRAEVLMPHDFLFPLNHENIETADCLIHIYDEPLINLVHKITTLPNATPDEMLSYVAKLHARLLPVASPDPSAATNKGRADLNEPINGTGQNRNEPILNWYRACVRFDALGTGNMGNILVIMTSTGVPLYYDYVENITPDRKRPYRLPRVNPIPGRAHGMGLVEIFEHLQINADLMFNRWNFGLSRSGSVIAFQPENTVEGDANADLDINGGETLHLKPGKTLAETIQQVGLTDVRGMPIREMLEFIMQIAMNMSGVTNTNDAQTAGLDTMKTATGVRNLEKTGQELTDKLVSDVRPGIKDILKGLMMLAAANLTSPRVFRYFEGAMGVLTTITPDMVQDLTLMVELELTKYRGEQDLQQNSQAIGAATQFYGLPPQVQMVTAPMYRQILKINGQKNADQIIQPMAMPMMPPQGAPGQPPPQPAPSPGSTPQIPPTPQPPQPSI